MSDVITLNVNGKRYQGWETVTINRNIDALASTFNLRIAPRWSEEGKPVPIKSGDACTIEIDGQLVLTGFIEDFTEDDTTGAHSIEISGRAKTGDLVDCSAILPGWQLRQKKIEDIAEALCDPFGIKVEVIDPNPLQPLDTGEKVKVFRIDQGETVYEALTRLTRQEGLLLSTSPAGNLQLSRAATIPELKAAITRGQNTKGGNYRSSAKQRFSQYILKSQTAGDDETTGASAGQLQEIITDPEVTRYRPMLIIAETPRDRRGLKVRAKWERNQRGAGSERITYRLRGWGLGNYIWKPNTLAPVVDAQLGILDNMLISSVVLTQTREGGTLATVEVTGPEAYTIFDPPKPRRKK